MKNKVSIIIPVYNVEKYLAKCLISVIKQTYHNLEIICINDGSTDNSPKILEEYAQKDNRIQIANKANGGLSSARNYGLDLATGSYCYFLDSDDWIEPNTIEILVDKMLNNKVDCVVHRVVNIAEDDICQDLARNCQQWFDNKSKIDGVYDIPLNINNEIPSVAWNKLYKMEIINKYSCRFPAGLVNEDEAFIWIYMIHCKKYYNTNEYLYNYLRRSNSIMATRDNSPKVLDILKIQKIIFETVKHYNCIAIYKETLTNNYIQEVNWLWGRIPQQYIQDALKLIKNYINTANDNIQIIQIYEELSKREKHKKFKKFIQDTFSIKNIYQDDYIGKQVKILGLKFKFKNKYKTLLKLIEHKQHVITNLNVELNSKLNQCKDDLFETQRIINLLLTEIIKFNTKQGYKDNKQFITNNADKNILNSLQKLKEFYFIPNKGNLGDVVIASTEYQYFDANNLNYKVYDILKDEQYCAPFNFVYGGGGIWHKFYQQDYQEITNIFKSVFLQKCVILPSSFYDCEDAINTFDERFTVFCRERQSYEYCKSLNNRAKFIIADDMVLGANFEMYNTNFRNEIQTNKFLEKLDYNTLKQYINLYQKYHSEKSKLRDKIETIQDFNIGYFLREDKEKIISMNVDINSIDLSLYLGGYACDKAYAYICTKLFLEIINRFNTVITDRLHVGICAAKLGKQVLLLDNSYKKLSEVYKQSLYKFDNVIFTTMDNLNSDIKSLKNQKASVVYTDNFSVNSFIDFIFQYSAFENEYGIERRFW